MQVERSDYGWARVGEVAALWRYPVKSLQGEPLDSAMVDADGVSGDRRWALLDRSTGRVMTAKRTAALLLAGVADGSIVLGDGRSIALDDPNRDARLSEWLDRDVTVISADESVEHRYQMTFDPPNDDAEVVDIDIAPGTLFDLAQIHLLTTATLDGCRAERPDLDWDVRRFRPNLVIDCDGPPFVEQSWVGRHVRVGGAVLSVTMPTVRCALPLRAQPGLEREPGLFAAMSALNSEWPNHLGVYAAVVSPGVVACGDDGSVGD